MTKLSLESMIRATMAGRSLNEGHAPALKIPEPERVKDALAVLHANGCASASRQDENTITISAAEANLAADVMDRAIMHGLIQAKPIMVSAEAITPPDSSHEPVTVKSEPHPPAGGQGIGEATHFEDETEQNAGDIDADGEVHLQPRSLNNRMQNKMKKIDEEEQVDEVSRDTLRNYVVKAHDSRDGAEERSWDRGKIIRPDLKTIVKRTVGLDTAHGKLRTGAKVMAREEAEQIDELSYNKLSAYTKASFKQVEGGNALDKKIAQRKAGIAKAKKNKTEIVAKAAGFREEFESPLDTVVRLRTQMLAEGLRKIATHHSECGKHTATVHKDTEWGEYRVKFHINGKHHEPADYHTNDVEDAHDTARSELKRMTKLNGALKEAFEAEEDMSWIDEEWEQIDELSKGLLGRYVKKAAVDKGGHAFTDGAASGIRASVKIHGIAHTKERMDNLEKTASDSFNKSVKRSKGINKAVDRLTKEEAEEGTLPFQIDEISAGTARNYIFKAHQSLDAVHKKHSEGHWLTTKDNRGSRNRLKGQELAKKKLDGHAKVSTTGGEGRKVAREEVELIDELSNGTLKSYEDKAYKDKTKAFMGNNPQRMTTMAKRAKGQKLAQKKLAEEVQIDELSKGVLKNYVNKSALKVATLSDKGRNHRDAADSHEKLASLHSGIQADSHDGSASFHRNMAKKADDKINKRLRGISKATDRLVKEELIVEKKGDVEADKAKKHLFKHKEVDNIGQSIHHAAKHYNYVQDAVDHVYNNHVKDVSYEDFDKMRPHFEKTFKEHGLK